MKKEQIIKLIEERIYAEYDKYKESSCVDFVKTSSSKIYSALSDLEILNEKTVNEANRVCPFCGSDDIYISAKYDEYIHCATCRNEGK